jgi:preprotein translocase subunit SecG
MKTTVLIIHTVIALGIIALVLLQRGKGAEAGAAFGAGASGTVFGAQGSTSFFSRTTAILAAAFFATSLTLAYISSQRTSAPESLLENVPATQVEQPAPQTSPAAELVPELPESDGLTQEVGDIEAPPLDAASPTEDPNSEE